MSEQYVEDKIMVVDSVMITTSQSSDIVKEPEGIAYMIDEPMLPLLRVRKSANAWWMDRAKVLKLIDAFRSGHLIKTALVYAGITRDQWQYFIETHPEFYAVKEAAEEMQTLGFMNTVNSYKNDIATARWFLEKTHPRFNPKKSLDEPLRPQVTNNLILAQNINAEILSNTIREIAREVFGDAGRSAISDKGGVASVVEGEVKE